MAKKYYGSGKYEGYEGRNRQESADSKMISYDYSATANLPQNVIMKKYAKTPVMGRASLEDTVRGVDYQMGQDVNAKTIKKGVMPEKF